MRLQPLSSIEPLEARIAPAFAAIFELATLDGLNGFTIDGIATGDRLGFSVSGAGDLNGDGLDDLVVSAPLPIASASGAAYVIFGDRDGFDSRFELSTLDGLNGFKISGEATSDLAGRSVSGAGDVNGDGFDDLIISADGADPNGVTSGASYVIFGKAGEFPATLNLSTLNGSNGFKLNGEVDYDRSGLDASGAGDVNGDGYDDLLIGAPHAYGAGIISGISYLVFGKAGGFPAALELSALDGSNGFKINGAGHGDHSGYSVDGAGDVNGDGFDDLLIGAREPGEINSDRTGSAYVVFGKAAQFPATVHLSMLDGANGFKLNGEAPRGRTGHSVSGAGDVNGDGFDDLLVGAYGADLNGTYSGASYVVFGHAGAFGPTLNPSTFNGANGFRIDGVTAGDSLGRSVSGAGDINGDGFDDLLVGASAADPNGSNSGSSYVIFGKATGFTPALNPSLLDGTSGFKINGVTAGDAAGTVSGAGDLNGDGIDDLVIGASGADPNGDFSGASYVVFGQGPTLPFISIADATAPEGDTGNGVLIVPVTLSSASTQTVTVQFSTLDGTASAGSDYTALLNQTLQFAPGERSKMVAISVSGDVLYEANETFSVVLSNTSGATIRDGTGVRTIVNDDAPPVVSIGGDPLLEGDSGTNSLSFTVNLSAASGLPATVSFASVDGTAVAASDYTGLTPGTLTFAPGETTKTITVEVLGDASIEDHETFSVTLSGANGATIGSGTATKTILNDDTALRITGPANGLEGDSGTTPFVFTVSLEKPSALPVTVSYATADGSANAGSDYEAAPLTQLTFAPGETTKSVAIGVTGDLEDEAHETFSVILSAAAGAVIAEGTGTATILNDDGALLRITDASLLEGHSGKRSMTFTVSLTAATALPVSVNFTTADGTATSGTDYTPLTPGTLTFAPGETSKTLTFEVIGDTVVEPSETFSIVLSDASNAGLDDGTGLGTILDDDVTLAGTRKATFADVDGELVSIKVNRGTLKVEDFTIFPSGLGAQLALIDLSGETEFAGANLSITAKAPRGVAPGDRFAHVGYINATGIDLGKVLVNGVLGQIDAGDDDLTLTPGLLSLSVQSIGRSGLLTQLPGGSLQSDIAGAVQSLKLADGLHDATFSASGDIGSIKITGDVLGGAIRSEGRIGPIKISGDLAGSTSASAMISARGDLAATTVGQALAIRSISIGGSVDHAQILAGYDWLGAAVNGDASIGTITVRHDWMGSDLVAGVAAGLDGLFGSDDDSPISTATPLIASIASIVIKGTTSGSANPADHFGFVSQQIGAFESGREKLPLTTGPSNDLTGFAIGSSVNVRVREVV